jgi:integral membrane protein (TIGR00529 family)
VAALWKLGATALLIVVLISRRLKLATVMLVASVFLGLIFGLPPLAVVKSMWVGLSSWETINLLLILSAVMLLETFMSETGSMQRMVDRAREAFRDPRLAVAALPAFIGMLPSAGGAVFSCPMVDQVGESLGLSPERKAYINYWYRHLFEYWLPLYQAVVLAASILVIPTGTLIRYLLPFTAFMAGVGALVAFGGMKSPLTAVEQGETIAEHFLVWTRFLAEAWHIIAIIILVLAFNVNVALSILLVLVVLLVLHRYPVRRIPGMVSALVKNDIILTIATIMAFRGVLLATGAVEAMPELFASLGLPPLLAVLGIPFCAGLLMGSSVGYVGVSFPLIQGLLVEGGMVNLPWAALAYAAGQAGFMISPLHLCFPLSVDYFRAAMGPVWVRIALSQAAVMALGLALYLLL